MAYVRSAMNLSSSSKITFDPLSSILSVLEVKAADLSLLKAGGDWALHFPAVTRLKFVALLEGECVFQTAGATPQHLRSGDIVLIGEAAYTVASRASLVPQDGTELYREQGSLVRLGDPDTVLLGGSVRFDANAASFLLRMLPGLMIVKGQLGSATAITDVLRLLDQEAKADRPGKNAIMHRLAEVLVVEGLRQHADNGPQGETGWLAAFADARISRTLRHFHDDVSGSWTVERLASVAGMSRASFAASFAQLMGMPPLAYVRLWRLTLARQKLMQGIDVGQVAQLVGYSSQSAFGHAFRRLFGTSPGDCRPRRQRLHATGDER